MTKDELISYYKRNIAMSRRDIQDLYVEILGQLCLEESTPETMRGWALNKKEFTIMFLMKISQLEYINSLYYILTNCCLALLIYHNRQ